MDLLDLQYHYILDRFFQHKLHHKSIRIKIFNYIYPKGEKADSVYPGYGNNPHNPEDTMAIQPILSRYVTDTEDIVSLGSRSYSLDSLDLHRISWILWISTVSSGFSGFPWYPLDSLDSRCIVRIRIVFRI